MSDFVFRRELEEATVSGAQIVYTMVGTSIDNNELPPKDVLEWFVEMTAYQFAQAEHDMLTAEQTDEAKAARTKEVVQMLAQQLRALLGLASQQKMFWMSTRINDILRTRQLRLPERYQQLLQGDNLP